MTWITNDRATAKQLWDVDNVLEAVYTDILKHPAKGAKRHARAVAIETGSEDNTGVTNP